MYSYVSTNSFSSSSSKEAGKRPRPNFRFDARLLSNICTWMCVYESG